MRKKANRPYTDFTSKTDPSDPEAIPAFEDSAGISPKTKPRKPIVVNKTALENFTKDIDPAVQKYQLEAANIASMFAKRAIRPDEIAALRRRMFEVVSDGVEDVAKVMKGEKEWSSTQVRLFSILTERVMPKLSNITVEDNTSKKLEDMSIEELEQIALGKRKHEAVDAVIKQGKDLESEAEASEAKEIKKLRKIKHLASIDEAEKAYAKSLQPKEVAAPVLKKSTSRARNNSKT